MRYKVFTMNDLDYSELPRMIVIIDMTNGNWNGYYKKQAFYEFMMKGANLETMLLNLKINYKKGMKSATHIVDNILSQEERERLGYDEW